MEEVQAFHLVVAIREDFITLQVHALAAISLAGSRGSVQLSTNLDILGLIISCED